MQNFNFNRLSSYTSIFLSIFQLSSLILSSLPLALSSGQVRSDHVRWAEEWRLRMCVRFYYYTVQYSAMVLWLSLLFPPTPLSDSTPTSMSVNDCTCSNTSINQIKSEKERECDSLYSVLSSAVSFWFHLRPFFSWGRETAPIVCRSLQVQKHVQVDISDRVEGGDG